MRGTWISRWAVAIPMMALAVATIYPLLFTANVAMKTTREYILDRFSVSPSLRWDNAETAWNSGGMAQYFVNSVIVVAAAVALLLLIGSMAGFALSHIRFRGSRALFLGCLAALFVPFQVIMVPLARTMADSGLIDTYPGLSWPTSRSSFPSRSISWPATTAASRMRSSMLPALTETPSTASTGGSCSRWARRRCSRWGSLMPSSAGTTCSYRC